MHLEAQSLSFIKDLYMLKVKVTENKDTKALDYLKDKHPELFEAKFLLEMLKDMFHDMGLSNKKLH